MTKAELIDAVKATKCCSALSKKDIEGVIDCAFDAIAKGIKKDKRMAIPDFGVFTVRSRKARMGRNPQTGAAIKIPASKTVGFKPAPALKKGL
ncbi:MAG: HU family DNA-binding protein [bacterium]|nr:HU family DNA-binding protein [bacterium]